MVDRRSVLKLGAAGLAGTFLPIPSPAPGAWAVAPRLLKRAVYDERFEESVAFAEELRRRGVATASAGSDLARLWYGNLHVQPGQPLARIAGLTDRATLFCLEELSRSAGMRVLYRVDHLIDDRGHVEHDAVGPAAVLAAARKLMSDSGFGREMAVLASHFDSIGRQELAAVKRTGPFSPRGKVALVSWVIA